MISRHHFVEIKRVKELALSTSRRPIMVRSHRCHAHDQQFAEILIAPVRNPTGFGLTASRMLAPFFSAPILSASRFTAGARPGFELQPAGNEPNAF